MSMTDGELMVRSTQRKAKSSTVRTARGESLSQGQPAGNPVMPPELQFHQLIGILRRRRRMIVTVAALGTMLAVVAGLLIAPKYTAKAEIVVEGHETALLGAPAVPTTPPDQSAVDTHIAMLTSFSHLQHVFDSVSRDADFDRAATETKAKSGEILLRHAGITLSRPDLTPRSAAEEDHSLSLRELRRRLSVWIGALRKRANSTGLSFDEFVGRLKVQQERASRVIGVSFTSTSPDVAAATANRAVQLYVDGPNEQNSIFASRNQARIDQRVAELNGELERTRAAVQTLLEQRLITGQVHAGSEGNEFEERLHKLTREAQLQEALLRRHNDARNQQETGAPDARIVSLASPPDRPSSHNPILFILPALIASSLCASLL